MKVLIVGLGSIAKKHFEALLLKEPEVEIIALRSRLSSNYIEKVHSVLTINEAKTLGPYDFIIISNPTYKHIETINLLLAFHCPLFIEKPLSNTLDHADIINKVIVSGVGTYVACNLRFLDF